MTTRFRFKGSASGLALAAVAALSIGILAIKPLVAHAKDNSKVYSHSFRAATPHQVLAWMGKAGIQVRVDRTQLPDNLMTFAFDGMNSDDLVKMFGQMTGFQAEKRGDVYSLMKGVGGDGPAEHLGSEGVQDPCPIWEDIAPVIAEGQEEILRLRELEQLAPLEEMMFFEGQKQDLKGLVEEIMKAVEESGAKLNPEQKAKLREKLSAKLGGMHGSRFFMAPKVEPFLFKMDPEQMKKWEVEQEKAMAELKKHMEELRKSGKLPEGHFYTMPEGAFKWNSEEWQKRMEELRKSGKHPEGTFFIAPEHFKFNSEDHKKAMEELHKHMQELEKSGVYKQWNSDEFKKHMEEMQKHLGENMKVLQLKLENLKKFAASLTPAQKALHEKQGFLSPSDLTKEQRELLGIGADGEMDMTFQFDGQKIVIKSKKAPTQKGVVAA